MTLIRGTSAFGTLRQFCDGRCSVANAASRHRYKSGLRSFDAAGGELFTEGEPKKLSAMPEIRKAYLGL